MPRSRSAFARIFRRKHADGTYRPGYYVRFRDGDQEVTRWAGPDRKTAQEFAANLLRKTARESLLGEKAIAAVPFSEMRKALNEHLAARHASETVNSEKARFDRIDTHFGSRPIREFGAGDVQGFVTALHAEGLSTASINRHLAALSVAFRFAVERGYASANPARGIARPREAAHSVPFLTSETVEKIIAKAGCPAFAAMLRLLADGGLRRGEALRLEWKDVDLTRRVVTVRQSKTKRPREIPMTDAANAALSGLRDARGAVPMTGPDFVWPTLAAVHASGVSARFDRAAKSAGFADLRLHDLRHGFASRLAQAGVPIPTIAALCGHLAIATTMRYASHQPESAALDAIRKLNAPAPAKTADSPTTKAATA